MHLTQHNPDAHDAMMVATPVIVVTVARMVAAMMVATAVICGDVGEGGDDEYGDGGDDEA